MTYHSHTFQGRCNAKDRTTPKHFAKDRRMTLAREALFAFAHCARKSRKRRKRPTMAGYRHVCCTGEACVYRVYMGNKREVTANVVIWCDGETYGAHLTWRRQPWPTKVLRP